MPYDDPDATDPLTLHGVEVPVNDESAARDMAECFVEEFLRLGHSPAAIMDLFLAGEFGGPALALRQLGRAQIEAIIGEQLLLRGGRGKSVKVERAPSGAVSLPTLDA